MVPVACRALIGAALVGAALCHRRHFRRDLPPPISISQEIDLGRKVDTQRAFVREALSMQQLRHPHVVAFFGVRQASHSPAGSRSLRLRARQARGGLALPACPAAAEAEGAWRLLHACCQPAAPLPAWAPPVGRQTLLRHPL